MHPFTIEVSQAISVDLARINPGRIYVYEDTLDRSGSSGQAKLRDEPNACGIPIRKAPGLTSTAVFSDQEHEFQAVTDALRHLYRAGRNRTVVFPQAGIGHGPYGLVSHSPKLYDHLCGILQEHFGYQQPLVTASTTASATGAQRPYHHQLFTEVCTRGGIQMASLIAEQHQLSIEELKAFCCKAGAELEAQARLYPLHRPIYGWARSE